MPNVLKLVPQEIPFDDPDSNCSFRPEAEGLRLVVCPRAIELYSLEVITKCLRVLQQQASNRGGSHESQKFEAGDDREPLYFLQEESEYSISVSVPSEY